jgi:hypothetical protein
MRKMQRTTKFALSLVCVLTAAGCSGGAETMLSPSAIPIGSAMANADGSTIKVDPPRDLSPNGSRVDSRRPTLSFTNPTDHFTDVQQQYEIEVQNAAGDVVYTGQATESGGTTSYTLSRDLAGGTTYWWRARVRIGDQTGPWSEGFATFDTPSGPVSAAPGPNVPTGNLPFPVPAECGPFGPGDRTACVIAMTAVSPWWAACAAGSGTNCHRFTRTVALALATHDPRWGLLTKNPGEQQCTWNACGPGNGSGYGEDVVVHLDGGTLRGWDIVSGAGAPGARAGWSRLEAFRAGNHWAPVPPLGSN